VEKANLDAFLRKSAEMRNDRIGTTRAWLGNQHRLEVGGHDVDRDFRPKDAVADDAGEMGGVDDQLGVAAGKRANWRSVGQHCERTAHHLFIGGMIRCPSQSDPRAILFAVVQPIRQ
jgi:hypothetical protein